jgi:hypothetical protein
MRRLKEESKRGRRRAGHEKKHYHNIPDGSPSLLPLAGCNKNETASGGEGLGVWYRYKEISSAAGSPVSVILFLYGKQDRPAARGIEAADDRPQVRHASLVLSVECHITSYNLSDGVLDVYLTAVTAK